MASSWHELILDRASETGMSSPGTYLICTSYFWMCSIILVMRGGALDRCYVKIALSSFGRIPRQQAGNRHSNGTSPSHIGQLAFPSWCWSNDFLLRSTTCWQTPLDHWLVGEQHLDPGVRYPPEWLQAGYCQSTAMRQGPWLPSWCSQEQTDAQDSRQTLLFSWWAPRD